jgi:hypothetical protein
MIVHIHYPRIWNSIQVWSVDIDTKKVQVYFVFEHKNFCQGKKILFIQFISNQYSF